MDREYYESFEWFWDKITYNCRGCKEETDNKYEFERCDAYGIYTGLYCDNCYENNYPYKKHRYHDEAYCGERLEEDY